MQMRGSCVEVGRFRLSLPVPALPLGDLTRPPGSAAAVPTSPRRAWVTLT